VGGTSAAVSRSAVRGTLLLDGETAVTARRLEFGASDGVAPRDDEGGPFGRDWGAGEAAAFGKSTREAVEPIGDDEIVHMQLPPPFPSRQLVLSIGEVDSGDVRLNFMVIFGRSSGEPGVDDEEVGAKTPDHTTLLDGGDCVTDLWRCRCCGCGIFGWCLLVGVEFNDGCCSCA